jgi:CRP/FNR family transcriptional regulator, cyclic AMP receptor protein
MAMDLLADWMWLGHVGIILLIGAVLAPREEQRAVLVALGALDGVAASIFVLNKPSYALLFSLVIIAVLVKWALRSYRRMDVRFSAEEQQLRNQHLSELDAIMARRLIDEGHWINGRKGDVLVEEAQAAPCLFFLSAGSALVTRDGIEVGRCGGGDLIGEATAVEGGSATGTVRLVTNGRLWFVPAERLRAFLAANPAAVAGLQSGFAKALRSKLADANARAAAGGAA